MNSACRFLGDGLDFGDVGDDLLCRLCGLTRQFLDLGRHNGETLACRPGARRLDSGVQCEHVGLSRHTANQRDDIPDPAGGGRQGFDDIGCLLGIGHDAVDDARRLFHLGGDLADRVGQLRRHGGHLLHARGCLPSSLFHGDDAACRCSAIALIELAVRCICSEALESCLVRAKALSSKAISASFKT